MFNNKLKKCFSKINDRCAIHLIIYLRACNVYLIELSPTIKRLFFKIKIITIHI